MLKLRALLALTLASTFLVPAALADETPLPERKKCDKNNPIETTVVVVGHADGDTVRIRAQSGDYNVRFIGIDTPETHYMGQSQGEWGEKASEFTKSQLPVGTRVRLEFSPSICDGYGRYLAHIFKGDMHINKELAAEGLAVNYCISPSLAYCEDLGIATENAMRMEKGLFSDENYELPYDFRRRLSGREQSSFVGSIRTKEVYRPGNQNLVPVGERVFFFSESSIKPPYQLVEAL